MLQKYLQKQEYFIDRISFQHKQNYYHGSGVMLWDSNEGFHIMAHLKREGVIPKREEIRAISFSPPTQIRMKLSNGSYAIVPNVRIGDELALGNKFITTVHRVIFIESNKFPSSSPSWFGSSLYKTNTNLTLPDPITRETKIGTDKLEERYSRLWINFSDETGFQVKGQIDDNNYLLLHWELPKSHWKKQESMCWAQGLQESIALVAGESIQLLSQKIYRNKRIYTDIRLTAKPKAFGIVFRPFDYNILDKNVIIRLAKLLTKDKKKGYICRRILHQLSEASQQETRAARELLLSTILEAALRTLYNYPFVEGNPKKEEKFPITDCLEKFIKEYFNPTENEEERAKLINKILEVRTRLRHRNAHPDWLTSPEGSYSPEKLHQSANDMIFLSRFYGYMILALAGFKNLQPSFPKPLADWDPMIKIKR